MRITRKVRKQFVTGLANDPAQLADLTPAEQRQLIEMWKLGKQWGAAVKWTLLAATFAMGLGFPVDGLRWPLSPILLAGFGTFVGMGTALIVVTELEVRRLNRLVRTVLERRAAKDADES